MRVLVTGGAGFIGSACVRALRARGDECVIVDNFEPLLYERALKVRNLAWIAQETGDEVQLYEVDIRDAAALRDVFARERVDAVLHLAAVAGVRPSIQQPALYYDINVTGTSNLLEAARAAGVTRFALASSSSVYGGNTKVPFAETDPVEQPISPYAASKRALELLARTHHTLYGGDIACLRFFTVYGERQRPEMAIHKFMRLLDEGAPIPMFGDGSTGRDYTYIDDIVDGVLRALDRIDGYRIYNLGGDEVILLRDLIAALAEVTGVTPNIDHLPMQPGDVLMTNADVTRARNELGYVPRTALPDGLRKMWSWYLSERDTILDETNAKR